MTERRTRRSDDPMLALRYQLEACTGAGVDALVLVDDDGLCMAAAGGDVPHDEIAAHTAVLGRRVESFEGVIYGPESQWNVRIRRFHAEGSPLYVCAVGGGGEERAARVQRSIGGVARILAS